MMKSMSSIMSTVCICGLLDLDFFDDVSFMGETFLLLDASTSLMGSLGGFTFPYFCLSSSPLFSSFSTSSSPPPPGELEAVSSDALFISCTFYFFSLLLLLGALYSSRVTMGLSIRSGSDNLAWSTGIRNFAGHSLLISSMSSSVSL
jgi:hypothetical protein